MKFILLSGNSGKRLWPLSSEVQAMQFMKIFKNKDNEYESNIQKNVKGIRKYCKDSDIIVTSIKKQVSTIKSQLNDIDISVEPELKGNLLASILWKD